MARETFYRQCSLTRPSEGGGEVRIVTWIPERGNGIDIKPGVTMKIAEHGSKDFSEERWTVQSVGTKRQPESRVRERAHNWQKYRQATDV